MGSTLENLQLQAELDSRLIRENFDNIFSDESFVLRFAEFLPTTTGQKWLTKKNGLKYLQWQNR